MGVPAATPITFQDWLNGASGLGRSGLEFESSVGKMLGAPFVRATNSGRSALFLTLQAWRRRNPRDEVIIPAFVCPSVGRAVVKAGLQPVLCDVNATGSGLDPSCLSRLIGRRTLAVVTAHLYGYPSEIRQTLDLARDARALVIEDACQAFGAKLAGRYVGTFGDAGIFSFGMSKPIWTGGGGLIATHDPDLIRHAGMELSKTGKPGTIAEALSLAKVGVLAAVIRSHHLGPLAKIWSGSLRGRDDCSDFAIAAQPGTNAAIGCSLLARIEAIHRIRREHAAYYFRRLSMYDAISLPETAPTSEPVYVRFPIVVHNVRVKQEILRKLHAHGINASEMYARQSYEGLKGFAARSTDCPATEYLVDRMINLPTHAHITMRDLENAISAFAAVLDSHPKDTAVSAAAGGEKVHV